MFKNWLIEKVFKIVIVAIVLGVGIWYLSASIGGASLSYTSMDTFMHQLGAADITKNGVPGCFLCGYMSDLFAVMGRATEMFWNGIVHNLWILMAVGFGIFIIFHTIKFFREQATSKDIKDLTTKEPTLDFQKWFSLVWKTGVRVLIIGGLIGALNWSGTGGLRTITNVTVTPILYLGSALSEAATGVVSNQHCKPLENIENEEDILNPVLQPFMCVIANLNTVMLAGAGGGFALMNYSWMGLGGGVFTWTAGLALVLVFMIIGFKLLFQVLGVIFRLIFVIIFMPILLASTAFEGVWKLTQDLTGAGIDMLVNAAVSIIKISLKICIVYAVVYFSASQYGFTTILPPLLGEVQTESPTEQSMAVLNVFSTCEKASVVDGDIDKDTFKICFMEQRKIVEEKYPNAFDFMDDGFEFMLFMIGIALLYFWIVSPKIDKLISESKTDTFDYGQRLKEFGNVLYSAPGKIFTKVKDALKEGK